MVKVSGRQGAEGGADRDLVQDFREARREATAQQAFDRGSPLSSLPRSGPETYTALGQCSPAGPGRRRIAYPRLRAVYSEPSPDSAGNKEWATWQQRPLT